ncbi:unnamed protein product [Amoebophrya sp. A25]|nr:unnamed protein product [Amoebophrya sp. A25]|eukprot:GSA25T00025825001.1
MSLFGASSLLLHVLSFLVGVIFALNGCRQLYAPCAAPNTRVESCTCSTEVGRRVKSDPSDDPSPGVRVEASKAVGRGVTSDVAPGAPEACEPRKVYDIIGSNLVACLSVASGSFVSSSSKDYVGKTKRFIILPASAARVFLEIGVSTIYTMKTTLMKRPEFKDVFVLLLGFEPLFGKYVANQEFGMAYSTEGRLGRYGNGLILPFAVGLEDGLAKFNVGKNSGCSSLFTLNIRPPTARSPAYL